MRSFWIRSLAVCALLAVAAVPSRADVRYTLETGVGRPGMTMTTTTYVRGQRERVESHMAVGPVQVATTTMTWCDREERVKLDPDLKIYTVAPIGSPLVSAPGMMRQQRAHAESGGGTGAVTLTYAIEDQGAEKVGDLDTRHYLIHLRIQSSGCAGDSDHTTEMEEWISSIPTFHCPAYTTPERTVDNGNGCKVTYRIKGDLALLGSVVTGMPVRLKMRSGGRDIMALDLKDYSSAALDDGMFTVPADYKQVSEAEFEQALREKMMRNMHFPGGMPH